MYSDRAIAIREARLSADDLDLASSYNNFANTLNNEGKYDEAITHYALAEKVWAEGGEGKSRVLFAALAQLNMGRSYALKGDGTTAVRLFEAARAYFSEKGHTTFTVR